MSAVKDSGKITFIGSTDGYLFIVKNNFQQMDPNMFPKDLD
jgi:hypothetical protein